MLRLSRGWPRTTAHVGRQPAMHLGSGFVARLDTEALFESAEELSLFPKASANLVALMTSAVVRLLYAMYGVSSDGVHQVRIQQVTALALSADVSLDQVRSEVLGT
jgi:hypothetical protein